MPSDPDAVADDIAFLDAVRSVAAVDARKVRLPETLGVRPGERILEIGTGTGEDLQRLAAATGGDGSGFGVELVPAMAAEAKRRVPGRSDVFFVAADARHLPFRGGAFSAAYGERVLQHVPRVEEAIGELHRVLADDGRVLLFEPDQELRALDHPDAATEALLRARSAERFVNPSIGRRLFGLLKAAGFDVQSVEGTASGQPVPELAEGTVEAVEAAICDGALSRPVGDAYLATLASAVDTGTAFSVWIAFDVLARKRPVPVGRCPDGVTG